MFYANKRPGSIGPRPVTRGRCIRAAGIDLGRGLRCWDVDRIGRCALGGSIGILLNYDNAALRAVSFLDGMGRLIWDTCTLRFDELMDRFLEVKVGDRGGVIGEDSIKGKLL